VINALLERKGGHTALFTTAGFRDVYEIGRINRPDSFNLFFRKHVPLIPRKHVYEIDERMLGDGSLWRALDEASVATAIDRAVDDKIESIAIVFLHSYGNVEHEARVKELVRERLPRVFVTASHEISREYREYERTSTTAANAYVGPLVSTYVERLVSKLDQAAISPTADQTGGKDQVAYAANQWFGHAQ
jgi:N-methylhydantoinase A